MLPPGVEEKTSADGRKYYVDHINQTTSWEKPAGQSAARPPPPEPPKRALPSSAQVTPSNGALPPGWESKRTADGRIYYVDHNTQKTSWTPPPSVHASPPTAVAFVPGQGSSGGGHHVAQAVAYAQPMPHQQQQPIVVQSWSAGTAPPSQQGQHQQQQPIVVQSWASGTPGPLAQSSTGVIEASGRRKALLVGCNYRGTSAALRGCINDVHRMRTFLISQGFPDSSTIVLTDDQTRNADRMPTKKNILRHLDWLVQGAQRGDSLFFHFSGHGAQQEDRTGDEEDGYDETIVPCDFKRAGQITDDDLWQRAVLPLPEGARLTSIMDCCHSGTGLDLPFNYIVGKGWSVEESPAFSAGDVQLFSGCADDQTSADTVQNMQAGGAMTNAFLKALGEDPMPLYPDFMNRLHRALRQKGFRQKPQLSSSQKFDLTNRIFSLTQGFIPNSNATIGRIINPNAKKRRRRRKKMGSGGLESFLAAGLGGAVLASFLT